MAYLISYQIYLFVIRIHYSSVINMQIIQKHKIELLPTTSIKYTYQVNLGIKNLFKIFVCFTHKKHKRYRFEYNLVMNELLKYIDFHQFSRYFHDIENMKES